MAGVAQSVTQSIERQLSRFSPAMALLLLGPIFGELVSAHQSLFEFINPLAFILSALPYGFGAIICRELTVRWGKGWVSLVLLALAYGLYEEALVARSVWDPDWAELGALRDYSYWQGVVWTYLAVLLHFHLTISILSSVVLAEILFPAQRHASWVTDRQLRWCFVGLGLWLPVLVLLNPFMPTLLALVGTVSAIAALVWTAHRLPVQVLPPQTGRNVAPVWYGVVAALNTTAVFVLVFILPEADPAWLPAWQVSLGIVVAFDLLAFALILRWSGNGAAWDDRHKLALIAGFSAFYLVVGASKGVGGWVVLAAAIWGFRRVWQRLKTARSGSELAHGMQPVS
ncbi:hypothetical protein [Aggregatilinea lenta]|uniref:hypothetical protein n=1 Tax=Aggregatilinea lenta TaxID=913108 RepID=UPI0013C2ED51|nr:hypothetical protein [Aggregatilinea lenta]